MTLDFKLNDKTKIKIFKIFLESCKINYTTSSNSYIYYFNISSHYNERDNVIINYYNTINR
jgi:hypothetical protein